MTNAFVAVKAKLKGIGNARFTFFKSFQSSNNAASPWLKDVDLVFLCDATGGMASSYALGGVSADVPVVERPCICGAVSCPA